VTEWEHHQRVAAVNPESPLSLNRLREQLDFGLNNDSGRFACTLPAAAPEIIRPKDRWFIAALQPGLKGIQVTPLSWEKRQ